MKTIIPTEQDLILAFKLNTFKNPSYRRFRALVPLRWPLTLIGILFLGISIYLAKYTCYEVTSFSLYLTGIIFFLFGSIVFLMPFLAKFRAKCTWKKNKILHDSYILTWDQNNIFIKAAHSEHKYEWSVYCQMAQDESYILAYFQKNLSFMIPKRFFENNEEMQDFLNHLENGIKKNKEIFQ